ERRVTGEGRRTDHRREDPAADDAGPAREPGEDAAGVVAVGAAETPAPPPRPRGGRDQDGRRDQEELGVGEAAAAEQQRRRDGSPSRAAREGGGGREE